MHVTVQRRAAHRRKLVQIRQQKFGQNQRRRPHREWFSASIECLNTKSDLIHVYYLSSAPVYLHTWSGIRPKFTQRYFCEFTLNERKLQILSCSSMFSETMGQPDGSAFDSVPLQLSLRLWPQQEEHRWIPTVRRIVRLLCQRSIFVNISQYCEIFCMKRSNCSSGTIDERVSALYNSLGSDVDENIELCYQLIKEVSFHYFF